LKNKSNKYNLTKGYAKSKRGYNYNKFNYISKPFVTKLMAKTNQLIIKWMLDKKSIQTLVELRPE